MKPVHCVVIRMLRGATLYALLEFGRFGQNFGERDAAIANVEDACAVGLRQGQCQGAGLEELVP